MHPTEDADDPSVVDTGVLDAEPGSQEIGVLAPLADELEPRPAPQLAPGTRLGEWFEISERLGSGGMGVVYRARDLRLGRDVALKLHRPMARGTERLMREAESMAKLTHPNVATVHEVGTHEGMLFIAMELVEGVTARRWAAIASRTVEQIVALYHAAGRGLAAAHAAGLVHRDFKPENVLVDGDDVPRVVDFGLARPLDELETSIKEKSSVMPSSPGNLTVTGAAVGTPAYMALEQMEGRPVDARADQFAFGVSLFEALYGRRPFDETTMARHLIAIERRAFEIPARPRVPARVRRAMVRALSADPRDRFGDMNELLVQLGPDPRAARRRTGLVASIAAISASAVVAIGLTVDLDDTEQRCATEVAGVERAWSARRVEVETAFGAIGQVWSDRTLEAVTSRMEAHEQALREGLGRACVARARQATPLDQLDRQDECLRRITVQTDALVEQLVEADAPMATHAFDAALELPDPDRCAEPQHLAVAIGPSYTPLDASSSDAHALYASAVAHHQVGLSETALRLAGLARAELGDRQDPFIETPLSLLEGQTHEQQGHYAEAEAALERAFFSARRIDNDAIASEAARRLVPVVALDSRRWGEAALWAELGLTEARRRDPAGVLEVRALGEVGRVEQLQGRYRDALARYQGAVDLLRADTHPLVRADMLTRLGSVANLLGDYALSSQSYDTALALIESILGSEHPALVSVLSNIALTHVTRGRSDEAVATMDRVLRIARHSYGPDHPKIIDALLNAGVAYESADRLDEAAALLRESIRIAETSYGPDHHVLAAMYSSLSVTEFPDDREAALADARRAVEIAELTKGSDHPDTARFLTNLAGAMWRTDAEGALEPVERAIAILRRSAPRSDESATALVIAGETYMALERYDDAIAVLEPALAIYADEGLGGTFLAKAQYNLGSALLETSDRERGARLVAQGADTYESLGGHHVEFARSVRQWLAEVRASDPAR